MMQLRKLVVVIDELHAVRGHRLPGPVKRAVAAAVIRNPLAGDNGVKNDLSSLIELGFEVGGLLGVRAKEALGAPVLSYGKGVIVGTDGQLEHGAAVLHPRFGASVRAAIGHGVDIMPSTKKLAAPGAQIDIPLHLKDNVWSFPEMDGFTFTGVPDAPLRDEIMVLLAVGDTPRPFNRIGAGAANDFLVPKPSAA
eukprot:Hpha_TRINITY_DN8597_c0_g1::TRINITY_DN8597_c0_g1_i1::g.146268::m.146268